MFNKKVKINYKKIDLEKLQTKKVKIHTLDTKELTLTEGIYLFFNYLILLIWVFIILFPVVTMIIAAFNVRNPRVISLSNFTFGFDNFAYLFTNPRSLYLHWYLNTILISLSVMVITVVFVALNGYAYSRFKFAGSKHSLSIIMLLQMVPATASLISLYIVVSLGKEIGIDPRIMLTLIYSGGAVAGNTFIFKGYLDSISRELDDSAKIDGCGNWKLFIKILVPICKPMLSIIALWSFLIPFGDVILPKFVIQERIQQTLAVGLDSFVSAEPKHVNYGAYSAGALLAAIPPFVLFMLSQKNIVGGLSDGAVKG